MLVVLKLQIKTQQQEEHEIAEDAFNCTTELFGSSVVNVKVNMSPFRKQELTKDLGIQRIQNRKQLYTQGESLLRGLPSGALS